MSMTRLLLTRRWVGLTVLAAVTVLAFGWLGKWQFGRAYRAPDGYSDEPLAAAVAGLDPWGPAPPVRSLGRQAVAVGHYLAGGQQILTGQVLEGAPVSWVVTPLQLGDGSVVRVVRGWVAGAEDALAAPPQGTVAVTGRLEPAVSGVTASSTAARPGLLVRTAQSPPDPLSLQPVPSKPVSTSGGTKQFYLQNAVYTSQWWIFAALVVVYWWRLLRGERASAVPA